MKEKMNREEMIFPECGLSMEDVSDVAERAINLRHGADLLGVSQSHLYKVLQARDLLHLFPNKGHRRKPMLTKEDLVECAEMGLTKEDTAHVLGVGRSTVFRYAKRFGVSDMFETNCGKAAWIARRGYCG